MSLPDHDDTQIERPPSPTGLPAENYNTGPDNNGASGAPSDSLPQLRVEEAGQGAPSLGPVSEREPHDHNELEESEPNPDEDLGEPIPTGDNEDERSPAKSLSPSPGRA